MCLRETICSLACGHKIHVFTPCPDALYTAAKYSFEATPCADTETLPDVFVSQFCDDTCPYKQYNRRWVCCECDLPNQRIFRCARPGCGHVVCDGCDPCERILCQSGVCGLLTVGAVVVTKRRGRAGGPSASPGPRVGRSRSVSPEGGAGRGAPVPDLATKPRIPVYDPSVGDWR